MGVTTRAINHFSERQKDQATIVGLVLGMKLVLFALGAVMFALVMQKRQVSFGDVTTLATRWDAVSYQSIAQHGYQSAGDARFLLVFFPLFPLVIAVFSWIFADPQLSALIAAGVFSITATLAVYHLALLDNPPAVAKRAVWWLLIFPTAYFLHVGYTEGLFLTLACLNFYFARKQHWLGMAVTGFCAALTRINGLVLIPTMAIEIWHYHKKGKALSWRDAAATAAPAIGFAVYLLINWIVSGDPWTFASYQHTHWFRQLAWPWHGISTLLHSSGGYGTLYNEMMMVWAEVAAVTIGLATIFWSWKKLRPSYTVWLAGNFLLFVSTTFIQSVPRYLLIFFPLFILLARQDPGKARTRLLQFVSIALLLAFWTAYAIGWWAF